MSCFWGHKWSKWEQYVAQMFLIKDPKVECAEMWQKRHCEECNYEERQKVS